MFVFVLFREQRPKQVACFKATRNERMICYLANDVCLGGMLPGGPAPVRAEMKLTIHSVIAVYTTLNSNVFCFGKSQCVAQ
jgi:hypothetical protein